jgi:predicted nucleic acid-binding protein
MTVFVDTNVLVHARDTSEADKQRAAMRWLEALWTQKAGRLSYQVLQEFYVTVTRKLRPGLSPDEARDDIRSLLLWEPVSTGSRMLEQAWSVQDRYRLSWWDSLIVAAAQVSGCDYLSVIRRPADWPGHRRITGHFALCDRRRDDLSGSSWHWVTQHGQRSGSDVPDLCSSSGMVLLKNPRSRSCREPCRFRSAHAPSAGFQR